MNLVEWLMGDTEIARAKALIEVDNLKSKYRALRKRRRDRVGERRRRAQAFRMVKEYYHEKGFAYSRIKGQRGATVNICHCYECMATPRCLNCEHLYIDKCYSCEDL